MRALGIIVADTFRQIRSSMLLIIVLILGVLVLGLSLMPGISENPDGTFTVKLLTWEMSQFDKLEDALEIWDVLKVLVADWFVGWLGVIAAVISTAFLLPDMLRQGSVELYLSRPISRGGVLLGKFVGSLAFVAILAGVVVGGSWLGFGIRSGDFSPGYLMSIPLLVFIFAIIHALGILCGVMFRRPIVTIVVSLIFWAVCSMVGVTHGVFQDAATMRTQVLGFWLREVEPGEVRVSAAQRSGEPRLSLRGENRRAALHTVAELSDSQLEALLAAQVQGETLRVLTSERLPVIERIRDLAGRQGWQVRVDGYATGFQSFFPHEVSYEELDDPEVTEGWEWMQVVIDGMYWLFPKPKDVSMIAQEYIYGKTRAEMAVDAMTDRFDIEGESDQVEDSFDRTTSLFLNISFIAVMLLLAWWRFAAQDY